MLIGPLFALVALGAPPSATSDPIRAWKRLERAVLWGRLDPAEARAQVGPILSRLALAYPGAPAAKRWTLPIQGGNRRWIGGHRGEGFHPKTPRPAYAWTDGNRHGGHPAHDVFIPRDKNRDCLDDRSQQPYLAVAMQPGVVLSINRDVKPGEPRGGQYVWLYQPGADLLYYYAHLNRIDVAPGQRVQAGAVLGTVGKTGYSRRHQHRPCHIHLMVLRAQAGAMTPYDWFPRIPAKRRAR